MEAGVGGQLRPQGLDRLKQSPRIISAAKARFPGPCRGVTDGGNSVADGLPVAVDQCHIDGKIDAGARHHLPLERIAMQIDDARQHQQATCIDAKRTALMARTRDVDFAVRDPQRGFENFSSDKNPAAFDGYVGHDTAPRRGACERVAASYFARKSSIASFLKSGRARRTDSWSQSHHASAASRSAMASGNRRLMIVAGFPATMV